MRVELTPRWEHFAHGAGIGFPGIGAEASDAYKNVGPAVEVRKTPGFRAALPGWSPLFVLKPDVLRPAQRLGTARAKAFVGAT